MSKNIELEIRAEIAKKDFKTIYNKLEKKGKLISETDRLSVMFFGRVEKEYFDARVRVTNGKSEVVIKKGDYHLHNRTEFVQAISSDNFVDMARILSQFGFYSKVGERKTFNFQFPNDILISLVKAGDYSYIELEKMTDKKNQHKNKKELHDLADSFSFKIIKDKKTYYKICNKFARAVDWEFHGTKKDYEKLEELLKKQL